MTDKSYESSMETHEEEKKSKSNRIWKILVILLLILLLFVVTTGVVIFVPLIQEAFTPSSGVGMNPDPFAGKYVDKEKEPNVLIPGWSTITIPANTEVVETVVLSNPNSGNYYLTYKLSLLDENGVISETLYESGLLPPGEYIQTITLSRGLAKGEYNAMMEVQPYRISDQTPTNNAKSRLKLIVE